MLIDNSISSERNTFIHYTEKLSKYKGNKSDEDSGNTSDHQNPRKHKESNRNVSYLYPRQHTCHSEHPKY